MRTCQNIFYSFTFACALVTSVSELKAQLFSAEKTYRAAIAAFKDKNYYSARLLFQEIIHRDPLGEYGDDAQYYYALTYFYDGEYKSAIFELRSLIRDYPNSPFVPRGYFYIGESYYFLQDYKTALESHNSFLRKYSDHPLAPEAIYTMGYIFQEQKRYDEAIYEFQKIVEKYPNSKMVSKAHFQMGLAYFNLKEYSRARREFQAVLLKFPESEEAAEAQFYVGKSFYYEDNLENAEKELQLTYREYPKSQAAAEALYLLALISKKKNNLEATKQSLQNILKEYPSYKNLDAVYFRLGELLLDREPKEAQNYLKELVENYPNSEYFTPACDLLGEKFRREGKIEEAFAYFSLLEKSERVSPEKKFTVRKKKADLLFLENRYKEAEQEYEKLWKENPQAKEVLLLLAQTKFQLGLFKEADELFETLIRRFSDEDSRAEAYFWKGEIAFSLKNYDEALQNYRRLLRQYPNHSRAYAATMGVGWSYFELKQYARALEEFRKAEKLVSKTEDKIKTYQASSAALLSLREWDKALAENEKITKEEKDFPQFAEEARFQLAWINYRKQDYEKALQLFLDYTQRYPDGRRKEESYYFAAWSLVKLARFAEAENYFGLLAKKTKDSPWKERSFFDLAKTQISQKKFTEAILNLENFISLYPQSEFLEEAYYQLTIVHLKLGLPEKSKTHIEKLANLRPDSAYLIEAYREMGDFYRKKQNFSEALLWYKKIEEKGWSFHERYNSRVEQSKVYLEMGDFPKAREVLLSLLKNSTEEIIPYKGQILLAIIETYEKEKAFTKALEFLTQNKKGLEKTQVAEISLKEATLQIELGNTAEARRILQSYLKGEFSLQARFYTGLSYFRDKNFNQALDYFRQITSIENPLSGKAIYYVGEIYLEKGEYEKAAKEFARLSYLFSEDSELYEKALYKAAFSFASAGKRQESLSYQNKLREAFPNSIYLKEFGQ